MINEIIKRGAQKYFNIKISKIIEERPLIINEAINTELDAIFVSVPKTGSTTIRDQIRQYGDPFIANSHLNIVQIRDIIYPYLLKTKLWSNKSFPTNDIPSDFDLRTEANTIFNQAFKFSSVRNPWARAVSIYSRREGCQVSKSISFEEFCYHHIYASDTSLLPSLHKNQYDWFCDVDGNNLMDYIYKLEDANIAIDEINEITNGRLALRKIELNKNPNSNSRRYREMYNTETKNMIAKQFERDIDLFKYTF